MAGSGSSGKLEVQYVTSLQGVVPFAVGYLNDREGRDLFETDHIVVPNAGVRAWLLQQLATSVGTSSRGDGIVSGVNVGYLGLLRTISGAARHVNDPWDIDPLTIAVMECLPDLPNCAELTKRYNGLLRAARVIADRFDGYHAHRPGMIEAWEAGRAELAPELGQLTAQGDWMVSTHPLSGGDSWQFDLWNRVRKAINAPSPPAQVREMVVDLMDGRVVPSASRVLVVGLQSLPVRTLTLLQALAARIDVTVVMVNPSPALAARWAGEAATYAGANGLLPVRPGDVDMPEGVDPLLATWLNGARESQLVLGTCGVAPAFVGEHEFAPADTLLGHIKNCIASAPSVPRGEFRSEDRSVQVHRTHELSRQVEILHDVILHAFADIKGLQPHEIVILCPDMAAAAPLLSATFDRDVEVRDADGTTRTVRIPLVVADRGLRQVSDGAQVMARVLHVVTSRASKVSVLGLLTSPPVMKANGFGPDTADLWWRVADRAGVQWGLSGRHRERRGADNALGNTQTWASALMQSLVGAVLPDAAARPEARGVVPLDDLDTADVRAVSALTHLVGILAELEEATRENRTMQDWASLVEEALVGLCGSNGELLAEPTAVLRGLVAAAAMRPAEKQQVFTFDEFAGLVTERVEAIPGRQPLRTGAVTATSMVPLRSVPFRVVCILGYDDGAVGNPETESDDLAARQRFIGDSDPRIDNRRAFLDAVLAAGDRFVVTCNGRSTKNNSPVPFITPLAEFVDMCVRAGAAHDPKEQTWDFVHAHPRHEIGTGNFVADGVIPGVVFSHSLRALDSARSAGVRRPVVSHPVVPFPADPLQEVDFRDLVKVVEYPEDFFFQTIGVRKWKDAVEADQAILPLEIDALQTSILWRERCAMPVRLTDAERSNWEVVLRERGRVPVGEIGAQIVTSVDTVFTNVAESASRWGSPVEGGEKLELSVEFDGIRITGDIPCVVAGERIVFMTYRDPADLNTDAALALLVLEASGTHFEQAIIEGWKDDAVKTKQLNWDPPLDAAAAARRLSALVSALAVARTVPMFGFGATSQKIMESGTGPDAREAFAKFVGHKDYAKSHESKVFGDAPDFDVVFAPDGLLVTAWTDRGTGLTKVTNVGGKAPVHPFVDEQVARSVAK